VFHAGGPSVSDLAKTMRTSLEANSVGIASMSEDRTIPGPEAVQRLRRQLNESVGEDKIEVKTDDQIASDAAAGSDYIKMREDRFFSQRDINLLEAHEGWVHVATTMNGLAQRVCTFLGKAAPRTTVTQEGLAVLTEMLNLRSHPMRLAKLMRRIEAIDMAANGATFLEVFESLRVDGLSEEDAWVTTSRVFRGSLPEAGLLHQRSRLWKRSDPDSHVRAHGDQVWQDQSDPVAVLRQGRPAGHGGVTPTPRRGAR
jgi:uncharacterized protein (TIGR02421 family)